MRKFKAAKINVRVVAEYIAYFFIIFITVRGETAGGLRPFGLGVFVALIFARRNMLVLAPAYVAAVLTTGLSWQNFVIAVTPCVLFAVGYFACCKLKRKMSLTVANGIALLSQIPYVVLSVNVQSPYKLILTVILAQIFVYIAILALYAIVQRRLKYRLTVDETISVLVLTAVLCLSLYDIGYREFRLFYLFFGFAVMFCTYNMSSAAPVYFAVVAGLGCAFSGGGAEALTAVIIIGAAAAAFRNVHPMAGLLAVGLADVAAAYYFNAYGGYGYVNIITLISGAALYVFIPKKFRGRGVFGELSYARSGKSFINKNRRELSLRLYSLANIFEDMQVLLQGAGGVLPDAEETRARLAKDVAVSYCGQCDYRETCFSSLGSDTSEILEGVLAGVGRKGRVSIIDMPPFITSRCKRLNGLIAAVNDRTDVIKRQQSAASEVDEGRQMLAKQMGGVAEILDNLGNEFKRPVSFDGARERLIMDELTYHNVDCKEVMVYGERGDIGVTVLVAQNDVEKAVLCRSVSKIMKVPLIKTSVGIADNGYVGVQLAVAPRYDFVYGEAVGSRRGEKIAGDVHSVKRIGANRVIFAVGDGMGSGGEAECLGRRAVQMVENFFEAGFSGDVVMALSNRLLSLGGGDGYSSIDLVVLDLNTGAADFIKLGATYTVLKHGETCEILEGSALPVGVLETAKPYITKRVLINNDFLVLLSDGVTDCVSDGEMSEYLSGYRGTNPEMMAADIADKARAQGASDDVTAVVVRIFTRA